MKVIIAGSRSFDAKAADALVLSAVAACRFDITEVVSGRAQGIDAAGERWALSRLVPVAEFPVDWKRFRFAAGPIRNREMAAYADALIAIQRLDGTRGTADMIKAMRDLGKPVFEVRG